MFLVVLLVSVVVHVFFRSALHLPFRGMRRPKSLNIDIKTKSKSAVLCTGPSLLYLCMACPGKSFAWCKCPDGTRRSALSRPDESSQYEHWNARGPNHLELCNVLLGEVLVRLSNLPWSSRVSWILTEDHQSPIDKASK
jgi:hypothetical protein